MGRRLPKHVLTISEAEQVLQQPDIHESSRTCETARSWKCCTRCGIRRSEVIHLKLYDLDPERGTLVIRQGKGKKDRFVPIGERAIAVDAEIHPRGAPAARGGAGPRYAVSVGYRRRNQPRPSHAHGA